MSSMSRLVGCFALSLAVAACAPDQPAETRTAPTPADTAPGIQPLSPAELQEQAEPMTPNQAEELGVVDTTIQVGEEP